MSGFILGFQRLVWWQKCPPASRSCFMVMPPGAAIACCWLVVSCCCCSSIFGSLRHAPLFRRKPLRLPRDLFKRSARQEHLVSARTCVYLTALTALTTPAWRHTQAVASTYQNRLSRRKQACLDLRLRVGALLPIYKAGAVRPQRLRGTSCISCRCRRGRDRCGPPSGPGGQRPALQPALSPPCPRSRPDFR